MKLLKTLLGIALIVGGMTAVAVGQVNHPARGYDNKGAVDRGKDKGAVDRGKKDKGSGGDDRGGRKGGGDGGGGRKDDKDIGRERPRAAPEIDGTSAVGGLALLSGLLLVFRGDRRV